MQELINKTWVIGVSGGADSMSLLDMCVKANVEVIVAHVNYQKRNTANRDMLGVQEYCHAKGIPCFVLCVDNYEKNVNFQSQARKIRYDFYKKLIIEFDASGVLVAHHMDDVIETYVMQQRRNSETDYYGIKQSVVINEMNVQRVLLAYTKEDLIEYCVTEGVTYYEDESNQTLDYTRNKIRHTFVNQLNKQQKLYIIDEINKKNKEKDIVNTQVHGLLTKYTHTIIKDVYLKLDVQVQLLYLRKWIVLYGDKFNCTQKEINEIHSKFIYNSHHFVHNINDVQRIVYEYDMLHIETRESEDYAYTFDTLQHFDSSYFRLQTKGELIQRISVSEEDFPIVIRNAKSNDKIKLRMGTKRVSRFFIDQKIPKKIRETWPVVVNKDGDVIFVYGIGCDITHFSNNYFIFMVK